MIDNRKIQRILFSKYRIFLGNDFIRTAISYFIVLGKIGIRHSIQVFIIMTQQQLQGLTDEHIQNSFRINNRLIKLHEQLNWLVTKSLPIFARASVQHKVVSNSCDE